MTAVNIDAQNPNYIGQLGAGRLDASEAVRMAYDMFPCGQGPTPPGPAPPVPGVDGDNADSIWRGQKPERKN